MDLRRALNQLWPSQAPWLWMCWHACYVVGTLQNLNMIASFYNLGYPWLYSITKPMSWHWISSVFTLHEYYDRMRCLENSKIALLTLYYTGTSSLFETVCYLSICRSSQVEHMLMRQLWVKIIVKWYCKSSVSTVQCIKVWSIQSQPGRKLGKSRVETQHGIQKYVSYSIK